MHRHLLLAVAAAVAVLAHGPAAAAASSSASYSNFGFQLIDLNPLDNMGASITFAQGSVSYSNASVYDYQVAYSLDTNGSVQYISSNYVNSASDSPQGTSAFDSLNAQASNIDSSATARNTANSAQIAGSTSGTRGQNLLNNNNYYYYGGSNGNYSAGTNVGGTFTLSANTIVIFSADATVSGATGRYQSDPMYYNYEQANSSVSMSTSGSSGTNSQSVSDSLSNGIGNTSFVDQNGNYIPGSYSASKLMTVSFSNLSNTEQTGAFSLSGSASGYSYAAAAAVPEPETYAMMLAGLCGLAGVGRRRQQHRGAAAQ